MNDLVTTEVAGGVADVRLNRPDKHNSLTLDMFHAIIEAGTALQDRRDVRAVVLSGNGPSFCAGLDMSLMQAILRDQKSDDGALMGLMHRDDGPDNVAQRVAYTWKTCPVPVIAAIQGVAYGGGCQIALGADFRIAAPDAKLCVMEIRYGLIPDMGITQTLPPLVKQDVAKELTMTGRRIEADEALELGLVTKISDDPLAAAFELATHLAGKSPDAVRASKRLFDDSQFADPRASLALEQELQLRVVGAPNQIEAAMASLEQREPSFDDDANVL